MTIYWVLFGALCATYVLMLYARHRRGPDRLPGDPAPPLSLEDWRRRAAGSLRASRERRGRAA